LVALQLALDLLSIEDAITIAEEAVLGGVNWLEVGTPLIKNHGMVAIKTLKSRFPDKTVVADMKTMDTGDLEVEMAAKNGADVVCILGLADDFTVKRAVNQGNAHNVRIMADLIEVKDTVKRAFELQKLGVDYVLIHTPIDIQKVTLERVDSALDEVKALKKKLDIPIAVAGGISTETVKFLMDAGAEIFVVGRAITKAKDVVGTAEKFCDILGVESVEKKDDAVKIGFDDIVKGFENLPTSFISDSMKRFGAMRGLVPVNKGIKIAGKAFTVKTLGGDWGKVVKAVDLAQKGDVIVVDAQGMEIAVWGELATLSAINKGIRGVVIDGAIRDVDDIKRLKFPVWTRYVTPNAGEPHGHGELNTEISCGGIPVKPGDVVVADEVGVVVVPQKMAYEILQKSKEVLMKEKRYKEGIKKGLTLSEIFGL